MANPWAAPAERRWALVSLGEVMLRFDPGAGRISTTRDFKVSEGGGEYNVARGLRRCFGLPTAVATALADNSVGRLVEDMILQGGVATELIRWRGYDGVGRESRNGLNFVERGFGVRAPLGCSDRGHTAVSQLRVGDFDWDRILAETRWFHTGGIFCGLGEKTPAVAEAAMQAARRQGAVVSYDLNYRASLWQAAGGAAAAQTVNRRLAKSCDVLFGNEEDFALALGHGAADLARMTTAEAAPLLAAVAAEFGCAIVAVTQRRVHSASRHDWGAMAWEGGRTLAATARDGLEIFDRVGGGDAFVSGFVYGCLSGHDLPWALECGAAHGALAMTTPGDTTMATLAEVVRLMQGGGARIVR